MSQDQCVPGLASQDQSVPFQEVRMSMQTRKEGSGTVGMDVLVDLCARMDG